MERPDFRRTRFWLALGLWLGRCGWQTDRMKYISSRLQSGSWRKPREVDAAARDQKSAIVERIRGRGSWRYGVVSRYAGADREVRGSYGRPAMDSSGSRAGEKGVALRRHDRSWVSYTFFAQPPYEGSGSSARRRSPGGELRFESREISRCGAGGFQDSCANCALGFKRTLRCG